MFSLLKMAVFEEPWGNYLLKDIVETQSPQPISWWPQTFGWKILLILAVYFLCLKLYNLIKVYQLNAYRREALHWLSHLEKLSHNENNEAFQKLLKQLPQLIRKAAIIAYGRKEITQLHGEAWEIWLDKQCQHNKIAQQSKFHQTCPTFLHQLSFSAHPHLSQKQHQCLIDETKKWLIFHKVNTSESSNSPSELEAD